MPVCTVAIPVYNRRDFIPRAIDSALAQRAEGLEILVVDNCSTDGTWEIVQQYDDTRLRLIRNETNVGLFGNFNRCLELAQGTYLRFLCSDDRLEADCLAAELRLMVANPQVALLNTRGRRVDPQGRVLSICATHLTPGRYQGDDGIYAALWLVAHYAINPFNYPSGILLRRDAALSAGRFDTGMAMAGDVDFFLRVLKHGDLAVHGAVGCEITIHPRQESSLLEGDTRCLSELCEIASHHHELIEQKGSYRRIQQQFAAYALGLAFKHWRRGQHFSSRAYRTLARQQRASKLQAALAVARLLGLRLLFNRAGVRWMPLAPQPLRDDASASRISPPAPRRRQTSRVDGI